MCGGTDLTVVGIDVQHGLSPRVRGNRRRRTKIAPDAGSIPACAGEPSQSRLPQEPSWVYPRVCGGTSRTSSRSASRYGLSPRVRGNLKQGFAAVGMLGSIPACAGEPRQ